MKYFTKQLYCGYNTRDDKIIKKSISKWKRNVGIYSDYLKKVHSKLPKKLYEIACNVDLHDGWLLSFSYGDYLKTEKDWKRKRKHYAQLIVCPAQGKYNSYTLMFTEIRKCVWDYPTTELPLGCMEFHPSEWAYHEVEVMKNGWISFEVWFFSGATLLVEFKGFSCKRERTTSATLPMKWGR